MATAKKLPSGSWRCQVFSHYEPQFHPDGSPVMDPKTGKQKQKRIYESFTSDDPTARGKKEAELLAAQFAAEKDIRLKQRPEDITLYEAIDRYIANSDGILSQTTIEGYRKIQRNRFKTLMGRKLKDLTNDVLKGAVNAESKLTTRSGKPISPKTIKNAFGLITAVMNEYVPNMLIRVSLPQPEEKIIELVDAKTIMDLVRGTDIELPVLLSMWLSFSMSEIRGLTKSKSVRGDYIIIQEVVVDVEGKSIRKEKPKTTSRVRMHRIPPYIKKLIDQVETDQLVPLPRYTLYHRFTQLLECAGLPHMTFHQLRHLNASVMAMLNIPDKYAQERGGWKTDRVMKKVYTHTFSKERETVDNIIDGYFENLMQHEMQHNKKRPL